MAIKKFNVTFVGVYGESNNGYRYGSSPIRVGGSIGYNSFLGFDSNAILAAIQSSVATDTRVYLKFNVTDAGTFDFGMHKETYNRKTASGIPYYVWTGRSFSPGAGWATYDITNFNRVLAGTSDVDTFQEALEAGFRGPILYGGIGGAQGAAYGYTSNSNHAHIEVHGTWNTPPNEPTIAYPTGGEVFDEVHTVEANPTTDAEQDPSELRYKWAVNDGTGWVYYDWGALGETTKDIDFSEFEETSAAKVAVKATDGEAESDYTNSNVFTIRHNKPPEIPTNLTPRGGIYIDRTQDIEFRWQHNDQEGQSSFHYQWRPKGETVWNDVNRSTNNEYYIAPAGTFPIGEIEWRVATIDQGDLKSPFSNTHLFYATEATGAPTIIRPEKNGTVAVPNPVVEFSSSDQYEYKAELDLGGSIVWSDQKVTTAKAFTLPYNLTNDTSYIIRVAVRSENGLFSEFAANTFTTSFTEPGQPTASPSEFDGEAKIEIGINNVSTGEVGEPTVDRNEVFRRKKGSNEFIKVANYIGEDGLYTDYSPASGVTYEYRVRAWGDNDTYTDSESVEATVSFKDAVFSLSSNMSDKIWLRWNPARSMNKDLNRTLFKFNGRKNLVSEYDDTIAKDYDLSFSIRANDSLDEIFRILDSKQTLLYRDGRGRRDFVSLGDYSLDENNSGGYELSLVINQMDYKEEVE